MLSISVRKRKYYNCCIIYGSLIVLPIIAAQLSYNQGVKFHRGMARLYNAIIKFGKQINALDLKIKNLKKLTEKNF